MSVQLISECAFRSTGIPNSDPTEYDETLHEMIATLKGEKKKPIVTTASKKKTITENLAGATIHATVGEYFEEANIFTVSLFDTDHFKAEDILKLCPGDVIVVGMSPYTVKEMTTNPYGEEIMVIMEDGTEIIFPEDDSGNMIAISPDDDRLYMHVYSTLYLKAAQDIIFEDDSDPDKWDKPDLERVIVIKDLNEILRIKKEKEKQGIGFNYYATTITLNDKLEIIKIHQDYDVAQ